MCLVLSVMIAAVYAQDAPAVTADQVKSAIDRLGDLDYPIRTNAAKTVRRAPAGAAVPALQKAVSGHKDGYVRYRALVLLAGFNDPRTREVMTLLLGDPNDRLREVAYSYFEHSPSPALLPRLLVALNGELADFVRPALVRALAAQGTDARVQEVLLREIGRGQDHFRGAVIESLGDNHANYAVAALLEVAQNEGPLQDDAVLALGHVGDKRSLEVLAQLQRRASRTLQPTIASALCLLDVSCAAHIEYLSKVIQFARTNDGYQDLMRASATGLGAVAVGDHPQALQVLFDLGIPSPDPVREAIALALGTVAIRNTPLMLAVLEKQTRLEAAVDLLKEGFEMLEEDFEEERFFASVRRTYWQAKAGSRERAVAEALIQRLEF